MGTSGRGQVERLELRREEARKDQFSNLFDEPLLNADEAAQLLHVPRSTLYELVRSRRLPHVRVGRSLRFTRVHLAGWVDENTFGKPVSGRNRRAEEGRSSARTSSGP